MSMLFKRIKNWAVSITSFRTGDVIPVDGPSGTAKMPYSDLAKEVIKDSANNTAATEADLVAGSTLPIMTANGPKSLPGNTIAKASEQAALTTYAQNVAHSIAPEFDPTRDEDHKYLAGESVTYTDGKEYTFYVDHYGPWDAADVFISKPLNDSLNDFDSRISLLEKEVDGESVVFSRDAVWGSSLNDKWKIGSLFANKTLSILVSCENPPSNEVTIYFATGTDSSTIITSETKTAIVGKPLEVTIPAAAKYIWIFRNASASPEKPTTFKLLDVSVVPSLTQEVSDMKYEVNGGLILGGSLVWGESLNSYARKFDPQFVSKKISILVSCENPPDTSVTIYFSTGIYSNTIIQSETKTAVIGTPLEVIVPETARYIWFYNATVGNSNVVTYSVSYVGDLTHRVDALEQSITEDGGMKCNVSSNSVQIRKSLSDGRTMLVVFSKFGPSNIMQLKSVAIYAASGQILSSKSTSTDSLGPFVVSAVNNADGTNMNSPKFTGGCHGYNGDQTGSATASCEVKVFADGKEASGDVDCENLVVVVTNKIQGWNTRKSDGTGREIIKETITYKISNSLDKILVFNDIEALEDVVFELYYGLQIAFARDAIRFACGEFSEWLTTEYPSYSGDTLDSVDGKSTDGFYQEMGLSRKGLGHFAYTGNNPKAFRSNTKGYYSLIRNAVNVSVGKIIRLAGYYLFNFIGNEVPAIKFGSFEINNAAIDNYFSVADLPEGTYKLRYYLSKGTDNVNIYTATGHQSSGIVDRYENVAQGEELTISITSATKIIWFFRNNVVTAELSYVLYQ